MTLIHKNPKVMLSWMKLIICQLNFIPLVVYYFQKLYICTFSLITLEHMFGIFISNGMVTLLRTFFVFSLKPVLIFENSNKGDSRCNAI